MITLIKLCNNYLADESLRYSVLLPPDVRTQHYCTTLLQHIPSTYKQSYCDTLLAKLDALCRECDFTQQRDNIRSRVVELIIICLAVGNKLCFKQDQWEDEDCCCNCKDHLKEAGFGWCFVDIIHGLHNLPKLQSLHLHDDLPHDLDDGVFILNNKSLVSLQLFSYHMFDISALLKVDNLTELMLQNVHIPVSDADNLKQLTKLQTLYLDDVTNLSEDSVAELVCQLQLPHLTKFHFQYINIAYQRSGFPELVTKCNCSCDIQCLQRFRLMQGNINLRESNVSERLLEVIGLQNTAEVLEEMELEGVVEDEDFGDLEVRISGNFCVVDSVTCRVSDAYIILKHQNHINMTSISIGVRHASLFTLTQLQNLLCLCDAGCVVEAGTWMNKCILYADDEMEKVLRVVSESRVKTVKLREDEVDVMWCSEKFPALTILTT